MKNIKISVNIPESMYEAISESARVNERTISGEVLFRLKNFDGELEVEHPDTYKAEVPGLDPENEYEIRERVVVKPGKKLDRLVKDGVVRKGVKELPSQDVGGLKTYFKEKKK